MSKHDIVNVESMEAMEKNTAPSKVADEMFQEASCKMSTDEVKKWSIVEFETDTEDEVERFKDLIPSVWITSNKTLCWYPMHDHKATIQKLAKQCADINPKWNCFSMKIIEESITNYDKGMKMLVKVSKNPNSMLYSDVEEKGKGKRIKKPNKRFDAAAADATEGSKLERKQSNVSIPPIPKLTSVPNIPAFHFDETQENEFSNKSNMQSVNTSAVSKHDQLRIKSIKMVKSKIIGDTSHTPTINNASSYCAEKQTKCLHLSKHRNKSPTSMRQFHIAKKDDIADINKECCNVKEISLIKKGSCKMNPKAEHKCAYTLDGRVSLESIADAVCSLSNELLSSKLIMRKVDKTIESFMESEMATNKNKNVSIEQQSLSINAEICLNEFPLSTLDDLKTMERKLKKDDSYRSKVINALHVGTVGDSAQKKINSMLRMVFDDNLAALFNWKGQRGEKEKLCGRFISKVMIEAIVKTFPNVNSITFGRKVGPWLAQASFRLKKNSNRNTNKEDLEEDKEDSDDYCGDKDSNASTSESN